jgi:hypothetical protein
MMDVILSVAKNLGSDSQMLRPRAFLRKQERGLSMTTKMVSLSKKEDFFFRLFIREQSFNFTVMKTKRCQ